MAVELAEERLAKGPASGYHFVFAERDGRVLGYTCYGPIALTDGSYDLYWIAVDKSTQGQGLGRLLMEKSEETDSGRGRAADLHRDLDPPARTPPPAPSTSVAAAGWRSCWRTSTPPATARRST